MNEASLEKKIVAAALKDRHAYARIVGVSDVDTAFSPYASMLLKMAGQFYERDLLATKVDPDVLRGWIGQKITPKNQEIYGMFMNEALALDVSAVNIADLVVETKRKNLGAALAAALLGTDHTKTAELLDLYAAISLLEDAKEEDEEESFDISVASLVDDISNQVGLIRLLPKQLDAACKSRTKKGHHILVFARPETGKTASIITLARGFAAQGLVTIIFGNEEPARDTKMRIVCCLTGWTEEEVVARPDEAMALFRKRGGDLIRVIPIHPGTPREIEKYVEKYKPDCIIVEQIRNLSVGAETRVNQLEMASTAMRNIGKRRNCLVVSVTQAGDSADGKLVLELGDVDFSKTGIPASCDLMVGIGVNQTYEAQQLRMYSTPKNKIGGVHTSFPVRLNQPISRMEDT